MAFPRYLAMTAGEFGTGSPAPQGAAWMACHFSPYGTGLSNLPPPLPRGSMVIVNDRTPIHGHDPALVARQLRGVVERYGCGCVLLDFQRPGAEAVAAAVVEALSCPVGVPPAYGKGLDCPVFLPPVPLRTPVAQYLAPWKGRELWLEAALDGEEVTVTPQGTACRPLDHPAPTDTPLYDEALFCHYRIDAEADSLRFHLRRTQEDLDALLYSAEPHGVTRTIGLWQEFRQCL